MILVQGNISRICKGMIMFFCFYYYQEDAHAPLRSSYTQLDLWEQKMTFELLITYRVLNRPAFQFKTRPCKYSLARYNSSKKD